MGVAGTDDYFYYETTRKMVAVFGAFFNDIFTGRKLSDGSLTNMARVPLSYGPRSKFLARINEDVGSEISIKLPRMSFELSDISYDSSSKINPHNRRKFCVAGSDVQKDTAYSPAPYNLTFELNIFARTQDDALQILEQILPYFQPQYNLTVNLVGSISEKRDIPVVLENITMQDDYEGDFTSRRVLLYTLRFTAKTYLFGPVSSATNDIIKKAAISYYSGDSKSTTRDITYSALPRAIKDYTGDVVTNLAQDIDNSVTEFNVDDGTAISVKKYIEIDGEEMFVTKISGNKIVVERGKDGTTISSHLRGDPIKGIDYTAREDSDLIEFGDDFGFSGSIS